MTDGIGEPPRGAAGEAAGSSHHWHFPSFRGRNDGASVERRSRAIGTRQARRALKAERDARRSALEVAADALTRAAASAPFLAAHVAWFAVWILWNVGALGLRPFDPFPFGLLTMVVSLEAIFLAIFVLMSQSRESSIAELREEITLQVMLRSEEEVTKTLQLVAGLYARLGQQLGEDPDLQAMLQPLDAGEIERDLVAQINGPARGQRSREEEQPPLGARGEGSAR